MVGGEAPASIQCSTPAGKRPRLALKLFRGERDISGFDRPFTPIHVFNLGGFGPPRGLTPASACPWIAHPASRLRRATKRPFRTRFRCGSLAGLTSPRTVTRWLILQKARSPRAVTRWLILQKARRHSRKAAPTACRQTVSGTVSLPSRGAFHLSLTVLVHYRSQESI